MLQIFEPDAVELGRPVHAIPFIYSSTSSFVYVVLKEERLHRQSIYVISDSCKVSDLTSPELECVRHDFIAES